MQSPLRISIIDPDDDARSQIARAIARFPECEVHTHHRTCSDALETLPRNPPNVTLVDISAPKADGIDGLRKLRQLLPSGEILVLTGCKEPTSVFKALAAGASGYLLKNARREELRAAILEVSAGGSPMTGPIARMVVQSFQQVRENSLSLVRLTSREREVIALLSEGQLYKEISVALGISYETVHNHIRRIYEKLQVRSRSQAVAKYYGSGAGRA